jgi:4-hydroxy-tetrahydrodipicolinate reductase
VKIIKVAVYGALGRMGQTLVDALGREADMRLVGAVDIKAAEKELTLPDGSGTVPLSRSLDDIISAARPEVVVDFSVAAAVMLAVRSSAEHGVNLVIGTSGLNRDDIKEIDRLARAKGIGVAVVPNFALGAVLMMHLARIAGKYFDYAEIIELHHHLKADSPSGTALSTAQTMAKAKGKPFSIPPGKTSAGRGEQVEGISIHSVRLPGLLAHQEVLLGGAGQTLAIRHDTIGRECFMPGVMLAIRGVVKQKGLVYGLETLLGLEKEP